MVSFHLLNPKNVSTDCSAIVRLASRFLKIIGIVPGQLVIKIFSIIFNRRGFSCSQRDFFVVAFCRLVLDKFKQHFPKN